MPPDTPIDRFVFEANELAANHPPRFYYAGKQAVYDTACPPGTRHAGALHYTRWAQMPLPASVNLLGARSLVDVRPTIYEYDAAEDGSHHWHVNFADPMLFAAYGSPLLAQDEWQVAEHPILGSLVEALAAQTGRRGQTIDRGRATPVLVANVERRCVLAADANAQEGRPDGIYGGLFGSAPLEVVRRATRRLDPPTVSNILAIGALAGGSGAYARAEIEWTLAAAYTGFTAAVREARSTFGRERVVIHTGWWGCGVFGGNKIMMTILQVAAARMAGVDALAFYSVTERDVASVEQALAQLESIASDEAMAVGEFVRRVEALELQWGFGDGN